LTSTWWEINFILTNNGDSSVSAGVAYSLSMQSGWSADVWRLYRERGLTVHPDINDLHDLTFILRNTSFVTPVTGWIVHEYVYIGNPEIWTRERAITVSSSQYVATAFNWQDITLFPGSTATLTFLVGTGPVPPTADLAEPTKSPSRSRTPSLTRSPTRSPRRSRTHSVSLSIPLSRSPTPTPSHTPSPTRSHTPPPTASAEFTVFSRYFVFSRQLVATACFIFVLGR
jgi:hypothetical protein